MFHTWLLHWQVDFLPLSHLGSPISSLSFLIFELREEIAVILAFPVVKNLPANAGDTGFDPWVEKIPWRRKWQLTPVFLPGKFYGQRSLVTSSPRDRKSDATE